MTKETEMKTDKTQVHRPRVNYQKKRQKTQRKKNDKEWEDIEKQRKRERKQN